MAARIGKGRVGGAAARELGIQLDDVAHIHHQQEGWAPFGGGQCARITLGLRAGAQQRIVEALRVRAGLDALGFEHEGAALVAVDEAGAGAAVAVRERDAPLEDIAVVARVVVRRAGLGHVEQPAQRSHDSTIASV